MKIKPVVFHIALILYLIAIFVTSSIPGDEFPKVEFKFTDKFVHMAIFGVLFILFFYSLKYQTKNVKLQKHSLKFSLLFTSLYGITDELHQYFIPNRSCEFADWVADVAGALLAYGAIKLIYSGKKSINIAVMFLMFGMFGCSGQDSAMTNYSNGKITVASQEAWLNLMPMVDENKNNFGFMITVNVQKDLAVTAIKDFNVYFNNDTLLNRKCSFEISHDSTGLKKINIYQKSDERYYGKDKESPGEVQFEFSLYDGSKKIKSLKTSKIKINRVY